MIMVEIPKTIKISNSTWLEAHFSRKNISIVLPIENHEFSKQN